MKIWKQLIWPLSIILILGIYLGINSTGKMNYKIPEFNIIDKVEIDRIEIEQSSGLLKLYSDNGVWKINPENLRADPGKTDDILALLTGPEFIDMVSEAASYHNYGLGDQEYISVKAWTIENTLNGPVRELFIGALNTTGNFTFVRSPDNISVFTVSGNIRKIFDITQNDIIDKRILEIDTQKIDKIEVSYTDGNFILEKSVGDDNNDIWNTTEGIKIDSNSIEQSIRYLSNSGFDSYIYEDCSNIAESIFKIILFEENLIHTFTIIEKKDTDYYCRSSFAGKDFILSNNTGTQIIKMFKEIITSID